MSVEVSEPEEQREVAIVSLGMSCQTAHQLRANKPALVETGIPESAIFANYFDWLICPPASAARLLQNGMPAFDRADIALKYQPFWGEYQLYFWHEFRQNNIINIDAHFEFGRQKFDYLRERFSLLSQYKRLVFVLSNTQGNLPDVHKETGGLDFLLDDMKVQTLKASLENYLGRNAEMLVITNKERFSGPAGQGYQTMFIPTDTTEWKGDDAAWENCLKQYFLQHPIS